STTSTLMPRRGMGEPRQRGDNVCKSTGARSSILAGHSRVAIDDRGHDAMATRAGRVLVEGGALTKKGLGDLAHLRQRRSACEGKAGVAQGVARGVDEKLSRQFSHRHYRPPRNRVRPGPRA